MRDVPDSVVGIRASGEVTGGDYRNVLIPAVEGSMRGGHKVRLLYVVDDDAKGFKFTAGPAWQDTEHPRRGGRGPDLGCELTVPPLLHRVRPRADVTSARSR